MFIRSHLKDILKLKGISQIELSKMTGIRPSTITDIISNTKSSINIKHTLAIANALEIRDLNLLYSIEYEFADDFISKVAEEDVEYSSEILYRFDSLVKLLKLELLYYNYFKSKEELLLGYLNKSGTRYKKAEIQIEIDSAKKSKDLTTSSIDLIQKEIIQKLHTVKNKNKVHEVFKLLNTYNAI